MNIKKRFAPLLLLVFLTHTAFAYNCEELASDNLRTAITRQQLDGFESIDVKLTVIMNTTLEGITVDVAEDYFKELLSQGASQKSAYMQSVNTIFREMLKDEIKIKTDLNLAIRDVGGINQLVTRLCAGRKTEISGLFSAAYRYLSTKKMERK